MKRVLEERVSISGGSSLRQTPEAQSKPPFAPGEQSTRRTAGSSEQVDVIRPKANVFEPVQNSCGETRRATLLEFREALSEGAKRDLVRLSEELFPNGLQFVRSLRIVETTVLPGARGQMDNSRTVQPASLTDRSTVRDAVAGMSAPAIPSTGGIRSAEPIAGRAIEQNTVKGGGGRVIEPNAASVNESSTARPVESSAGRVKASKGAPAPDAAVGKTSEGAMGKSQTKPLAQTDNSGGAIRDQAAMTRILQTGGAPCETYRGRVENRYITGAEIALAAIVAAAGARRIRLEEMVALKPDSARAIPKVQKIEVFLPEKLEASHADEDAARTQSNLRKHFYERLKMVIGPGDTLVRIADSKWNDSRLAWLIADINLNLGNVDESIVDGKRIVQVRSRQTIDIPTDEEVLQWRHRYAECKADDLITVVVETQVDRELLNEQFSIFVESGANQGTSHGASALAISSSVLNNDRVSFSKFSNLLKRENIKRRL